MQVDFDERKFRNLQAIFTRSNVRSRHRDHRNSHFHEICRQFRARDSLVLHRADARVWFCSQFHREKNPRSECSRVGIPADEDW